MKEIVGQLSAKGLRVAIVASRFNGFIVDKLIAGAADAIARAGGDPNHITVFRCPGAFEIPQVAARLVGSKEPYHLVVCLGCVIRGETPHFDYVAGAAAKGIAKVAVSSTIPVIFGVLTTDTVEQAVERAGCKGGNKGFDAAMAGLEMASLYQQIMTKSAD